MKNYFTIFFVLLCFLGVNAQELPNSGFESWVDQGTYEEPEFWSTPNPFTSLAGVICVEKSDDAAEGMYSARLETKDILGGLYQSPGLLTYGNFFVDFATQEFSFSGGLPITNQVTKVYGKYKYSGADGDMGSILAYSYRIPEGGGDPDTVAMGFGFLADATEWTDFEFPVMMMSTEQADTFNIIILSSGSFEVISGSVLHIDEIGIDVITSVEEDQDAFTVSAYPNPVVNQVTFETTKGAADRTLVIYDMTGRQVVNREFNSESIVVDLSQLPAGMYSYRINAEGEMISSGPLMKR